MIKIIVLTTDRADFGLLYHPVRVLTEDPDFDVQLIITGSHLVKERKSSLKTVRNSGFKICAEVPIYQELHPRTFASEGFSEAVKGLSSAFIDSKPDFIMVLGDRYEALASGVAATFLNIPIIHLCGGDITQGAMDDSMRHALTKLSHIHFPSNHQAEKRIKQMGEDPERILMVGSSGLDYIKNCEEIKKEEIFEDLSIKNPELPFFLVTFHPVTLEEDFGESSLNQMLSAIKKYAQSRMCNFIFTGVNLDPGASIVDEKIKYFCEKEKFCYLFDSLGSTYYINLLKECQAVLGNSSSGFYEAPFLKKLTLNIGERQKGRLMCDSILNVNTTESILKALEASSEMVLDHVVSPYGDGKTSEKIKIFLKKQPSPRKIISKTFKDIPCKNHL